MSQSDLAVGLSAATPFTPPLRLSIALFRLSVSTSLGVLGVRGVLADLRGHRK